MMCEACGASGAYQLAGSDMVRHPECAVWGPQPVRCTQGRPVGEGRHARVRGEHHTRYVGEGAWRGWRRVGTGDKAWRPRRAREEMR